MQLVRHLLESKPVGVVSIRPDAPVLAVIEGEHVSGVVSIGDLVKALLELQQNEIAQLQQYIAS
jgi:hypothetical protein